MAAPLLGDLGNRRLKLDVDGVVETYAWRDPEAHDALAARLSACGARPLLLASASPEGLAALLAGPLVDRSVEQITPDDVPLARLTEGTGTDRLLAALAAVEICGAPVVVADCGSAFTLDLVDRDGSFRGGAIGPGLGVARAALAAACPHLAPPAAEARDGVPADTAAATRAGTLDALAAALDGLATRFEVLAGLAPGAAPRLLSGGDAEALAPLLPAWRRQPDLVLEGLRVLAARRAEG